MENGQKKRIYWRDAIIVLLIIISTGLYIVFPRANGGEKNFDIYLVDNRLYFVDDGIYAYDIDTQTKTKISKLKGNLTQTETGLYFFADKGQIYVVENHELKELGRISYDTGSDSKHLIDVIGGTAYGYSGGLRSKTGVSEIFSTDLNSNETEALASLGHLIRHQPIILDDEICYTTWDGAVCVFDIGTGEAVTLGSDFFQLDEFEKIDGGFVVAADVIERENGGTLRTRNVYLYDGDAKTLRRLDDPYVSESHYSSPEGKASASDIDYYDPDENSCPSDIYYYKGELYFFTYISGTSGHVRYFLAAYDIQTGTTELLSERMEGGTGLIVCEEGVFYFLLGPRNGLYFQANAATEAVLIHN